MTFNGRHFPSKRKKCLFCEMKSGRECTLKRLQGGPRVRWGDVVIRSASEHAEIVLVKQENQERDFGCRYRVLLPSPHSCLPLLSESSPPGLTICQPSLPQSHSGGTSRNSGRGGTKRKWRVNMVSNLGHSPPSYPKGNFNYHYQSARAYKSFSEITGSKKLFLQMCIDSNPVSQSIS